MFSAKVKSVAILFLSVIAILQTSELWFETISNRNFFYTFLPQIFSSEASDPTNIYKSVPSRTIINLNGSFAVSYESYDDSDKAILGVLSKGNFVSASELDWQEVLKSRSIIYEYSANIPSQALAKAFGLNSSVITSRVKNVSYIAIVPQRTNSELLRMLFVDELTGFCYEYTIDGANLNEPLQARIRAIQNDTGNIFYIASAQRGFEIFKHNTFIPSWAENIYKYNAVTPYNPYSENGDDPLLLTVEKKIDVFFDNPTLKDTQRINGVYTYSTETVLVRYRPSSVLEYYSYRTMSKNASSDFYTAFTAAVKFLNKDNTILNDIYLSHTEISDNSWTFFFDYSINNFPVFLSDSIRESTGMNHAIEITVANNEVRQYKRYVCAFSTNEDIEINATVDFLSVIDYVFENNYPDGDVYIEDMSLGYKVEKDRAMVLYWFLTVNGEIFPRGAQ